MDFTKYHLKEKYRKVLDNLSDEDKIKTTFKKTIRAGYGTAVINKVITYYELKDHPLHKELALKKIKLDHDLNLEPKFAHDYCFDIIKGRWFEAEPFILLNCEFACAYAHDIIKGRWLEAEDIIKTSPDFSYFYARSVIKSRWTEAEEVIKTDPEYAFYYAIQLIKGRWIEAEPFIKTNPEYWNWYKTHFNLQG